MWNMLRGEEFDDVARKDAMAQLAVGGFVAHARWHSRQCVGLDVADSAEYMFLGCRKRAS